MMDLLAARGVSDQEAEALIFVWHLCQVHPCPMHAIIAFGKDIIVKNYEKIDTLIIILIINIYSELFQENMFSRSLPTIARVV